MVDIKVMNKIKNVMLRWFGHIERINEIVVAVKKGK